MDYTYVVEKNDSFYNDYQFRHFKHKDLIVAISNLYTEPIYIKTFNTNTKEFTNCVEIKQVDYTDLQHIDAFYDCHEKGLVVDVENGQYAYTSDFPHRIYEIDGNTITSCITGDKIYVFYSYTEEYQTGLFVFDIKNNTYGEVNDDFWYDKDIASCGLYGDKLLINVNDHIYNYNDKEHILDLTKDNYKHYNNDIIISKNKLLVGDYQCIHVYDLQIQKQYHIIQLDDNYNHLRFWDMYDDKLVLINGKINTQNIDLQICSITYP